MSYRFKLLLATCLTCLSIAPDAMADVSLQSKWLQSNFLTRSDRFSGATLALPENSATPIEQQLAAAPAPTSRSPTPAAAASPSPAAPAPAAPAAVSSPSPAWKDWIWWGTIGLIPIGVMAAILYTLRPKAQKPKIGKRKAKARSAKAAIESNAIEPKLTVNHTDRTHETHEADGTEETEGTASEVQPTAEAIIERSIEPDQEKLALSTTTRLARVDIVEALIHDLHKPDPSQRRKAIWELGQRGDSRAIQPLVDLLIDADSNQRGLILAAVTEISIRTLKPMNRALMLSMQDGSPDVRKNALRDVTRVFELVTQTSQILQYAASDTDAEVRETAEWALGQLNRVRPGLGLEGMSNFSNQNNSPARLSSLAENPSAEVLLHSQEETEPLNGG